VGKVWRRDKKISKDKIAGLYHPRWQGEPPWIELYVDRIFLSARRAPLWIPFVRDTVLGIVLYHELGHHIHYEIRPQYEEKEDAADNWSQRLILNHVKQTYWYLMPILVPAAKLYRLLKRRPKN